MAQFPATTSVYIHIPFCDQLCWFCGCHTKVINHYRPVEHYLNLLKQEVATVAANLSGQKVTHIHFGGGSPTMLTAPDFAELMRVIRTRFEISDGAEIAIEIDPRTCSVEKIQAYAQTGVNRASIGVQDFDAKVQRAINRVQSFELVQTVVSNLRAHGISGFNIDLVYGLPHQNEVGLAKTLAQALELDPERISLFGYAHVPSMKKHQNLIPLEALPDPQMRDRLATIARKEFQMAGYVEIGHDHFSKPDDELATAAREGQLVRNFQGYTTDRADALIGLGVSSISTLPQGYAQNTTDMISYEHAIKAGALAIARGVATSRRDIARREIVMDLMCFLRARVAREDMDAALSRLLPYLEAGDAYYLDGILQIREELPGRSRLIASAFDDYLRKEETRFSQVV